MDSETGLDPVLPVFGVFAVFGTSAAVAESGHSLDLPVQRSGVSFQLLNVAERSPEEWMSPDSSLSEVDSARIVSPGGRVAPGRS